MVRSIAAAEAAPPVRAFRRAGLIALCALISLTGCVRMPRQSMSNLWTHVPTWHRSSGSDEIAQVKEPPKASANVAQASQSADQPGDSLSAASDAVDASPRKSDNAPPAISAVASSEPPADANTEAAPRQRIRELKDALTADAESELPRQSALPGAHPLRLRVESLLHKAQELLKVGELREARRIAQRAADLSDSIALEFLPTEDRPNDLLREIDDQLDSTNPVPHGGELDETIEARSRPQPSDGDAEFRGDDDVPTVTNTGTVAANVPRAIHSRRDESPTMSDDSDLEMLPELMVIPAEIPRHTTHRSRLTNLSDREDWNSHGWDSAGTAVPKLAPKPPAIGEIEPLPRFRNRAAVPAAPQEQVAAAPPELLYWTDWLAVGMLAVILAVVGLALGIRRWRCGT
jgi:hypothetical protein